MIRFESIIKKFTNKGEKSGWTYIEVEATIAEQLAPGIRKSFKVKGKLDKCAVEGLSLLPMGEGNFIIALNASLRKALKKGVGEPVTLHIQIDTKEKPLSTDFLECLQDEPKAYKFFQTLNKSHQRYFSHWIDTAKTTETKARRISLSIKALSSKLGYGEMIRMNKKKDEI